MEQSSDDGKELDVLVIGAGFAGLHALYAFRDQYRYTTLGVESAPGVGGTWYWNCYPGARCDVDSLDYSYTFSEDLYREWSWPTRYADQPELERYANWFADKFDLRRDIRFQTTVTAARFDEQSDRWLVETDRGDRISTRFIVAASGSLSATNVPRLDGLDSFEGDVYHTARWPREGVDFSGKRVGVVGTGSSGVQVIPKIAQEAAHLTVFQRTPNFSVPAQQQPIAPELAAGRKEGLAKWREEAAAAPFGHALAASERSVLDDPVDEARVELDRRWQLGGALNMLFAYRDLLTDEKANEIAAEFVRDKIRATVEDPETAELLCPKDYPFGAKRLCVDTDYFETFNRDNVRLVDVRDNPIDGLDADGLLLEDGTAFPVDAIVFATGFDAMTGALTRIDIRGRGGRTLKDSWRDGPATYLGMQSVGFPNLFMMLGPGSPSVLSNMMLGMEQHVHFFGDCIEYMNRHGYPTVEPTQAAQDAWVGHVAEVADQTLLPKANSWYLGANIPGKPRVCLVYLGGWPLYQEKCRDEEEGSYPGFRFA